MAGPFAAGARPHPHPVLPLCPHQCQQEVSFAIILYLVFI